MKRLIILITALLLLATATASENKVFIVDASYDNGIIKVNSVAIKPGYAPDYKLPSESDYTIAISSKDSSVLFEKPLEIPLYIYTDVIVNGKIEGSIIKLDKTDFAVVLPYTEEASEIKILLDGKDVTSYSAEELLSKEGSNTWVYYVLGGSGLLILVTLFIVIKRSRT